jgi:cytochrome c biogenesis protein CcdA
VRPLPLVPSPSGRGLIRYGLLAVAVVLTGVAGYIGYVTYPRFNLPSVTGAGLLVLAAGAGVASFFSPCSFPLLLTLLAREVRGGNEKGGVLRPVLVFAGAFSVGAVAFVLALGALIGLAGRGLASSVTFTSTTGIVIRVIVGIMLVVLGLIQAEIVRGSFHVIDVLTRPLLQRQERFRRDHPVAGFTMFGFAYLVIGFG